MKFDFRFKRKEGEEEKIKNERKIVSFNILHCLRDFSLVFLFFLSTLPLPAMLLVNTCVLGTVKWFRFFSFSISVFLFLLFLSISSDTRRKLQYNSQQWKQHRIYWTLNIRLEWQNGVLFRFDSIGNFHRIIGDTWKSLRSILTFYWLEYQSEIGKLSIMNLSNKILYIEPSCDVILR